MKKLLLCLFVFLQVVVVYSQETPTFVNPDNPFVIQNASRVEAGGYIYLRENSNIQPGFYVSNYKIFTGLSDLDQLVLVKSDQSDDGVMHNEYAQYYNGLRVEGAYLFEHVRDGKVMLINGTLVEQIALPTQIAVLEQEALRKALAYLNSETYAWQDASMETLLKEEEENPDATHYPKGNLLVGLVNDLKPVKENYRSVWAFEIVSKQPSFAVQVYVDAISGQIIRKHSLRHENGPGTTLYNGTQTLDTKWFGGLFHGHHHLQTNEFGRSIVTYTTGSPHITNDEDDIWTDKTPGQVSAHWGATMAWDYYKNTHSRNGANGGGGRVDVIANFPECRAFQGGNKLTFGTCGTVQTGDMAALDVVGHEFTHIVTSSEANLIYVGEPGALNESFSDIFATQLDGNYTLGEDTPLGAVRDLSFPGRGMPPQPSTYRTDPFWIGTVSCIPTNLNDACGVHINSGVQNHWFYLLSEGGKQNGIQVLPIGSRKAAKIAYYNLCNMLNQGSDYLAARNGSIAAATILFGACSFEVLQTKRAWAAVGIGTVGECMPSITGEGVICDQEFPSEYTITGPIGFVYSWSYPSNVIASTIGNRLIIERVIGYSPQIFQIVATDQFGNSTIFIVRVIDCEKFSADANSREKQADLAEASNTPSMSIFLTPNPASREIQLGTAEK
jgi:bacillolysin